LLEFSTGLLEELPLLKLGFNGSLAVPDKREIAIRRNVDDVFGCIACANVVLDMIKCPVCEDSTGTETPCGHPLCNRCWSKIKRVGHEDERETPCPLCRKDIFYVDLFQ
jgi:hypothetical protein